MLTQVYEPMWGELKAHQAGMLTRILYIFIIAYFMVRSMNKPTRRELFEVGFMWMSLWLVFEWGGSILTGRPVTEILIGWNILKGYMWPYVLAAYLLSPSALGATIFRERIRS